MSSGNTRHVEAEPISIVRQVNFHDELLQSLNQAQQPEPLGPPLALEDRPSSSWETGASAGSQLASKLSQNNRLLTVMQNMSHSTGMQTELSLLTLRLLMSYIYIYIYMKRIFLMFLDHTQRRTTVGRTPLDE